jgi:hypothetical protein
VEPHEFNDIVKLLQGLSVTFAISYVATLVESSLL